MYRQVQEYTAQRSLSGNWEQLGPILDGATTRDDIPGVGRVSAIEFHPTDPLTIYAGAPAGGLWRTTNGGQWWESLTDDLPTLGISAIIVDPNNPDIIYIGTGDRDSADAPGLGVWKSVDGGETWSSPEFGMPDVVVGMMVVNPDIQIYFWPLLMTEYIELQVEEIRGRWFLQLIILKISSFTLQIQI